MWTRLKKDENEKKEIDPGAQCLIAVPEPKTEARKLPRKHQKLSQSWGPDWKNLWNAQQSGCL